MHLIATLFCCFVAANAWPTQNNMMGANMQNSWGSHMGGNNNMQGQGWGSGMTGGMNNMQGQGWGNGMTGGMNNMQGQGWGMGNGMGMNQGQMWSHNPNQNNWAQQNWGPTGGNRQQGQNMQNNIFHLLIGGLLGNAMGGQRQQWQQQNQQPWQQQHQQQHQQWSQWQQEKYMKDMEEMEEMMKKKMMKEMAEMVAYQVELKEKETNYMHAVKFLCLMVNASITDAKKNNETTQLISEEQMAKYEKELYAMNDHEKLAWLLKKKEESEPEFGELFFKTSAFNCETFHEYKMMASKMEKMENEEKCENGGSDKGSKDDMDH